MSKGFRKYSTFATGSAAALLAALAIAPAAYAQEQVTSFNIPEQPLATALLDLGRQAHISVAAPHEVVAGRTAKSVQGDLTARDALLALLDGSGLHYDFVGPTAVRITADPQSGSAAGDGADGTVQALIVTAQKKEEAIQDVPIAISAFTEKTLEEQKIEGGFDLLKAIPNVTFSKNNFTSYNFSIRGIGTKAVSATTDPGVAVSFNNIALIQNRLFEQEYFDVERVEVLRGPQGTLYGRNATAGVINVISAKPNLHEFDGWIKGEVGNYHSKRVSAMVNVPLIEDKLAIRFAGALTDRQGYDYNSVTKSHVNGRDLWSGRISIGFNPTERLRTNTIWEHFEEDDNRSRTGKQLCHRDPGPAFVGSTPSGPGTSVSNDPNNFRALYSQGCLPGSLYEDAAFGTPNGLALPFVSGMVMLAGAFPLGFDAHGDTTTLLVNRDPYGGMMQSRDLRTIASFNDPRYLAKADVVELNIDFDLTDTLSVTSQTAWDKDTVYSFQDYNRFNTLPVFNDTSQFFGGVGLDEQGNRIGVGESPYAKLAPGGVFCDPQLGCSNTLAGFDISQAKSEQFTQELRLQSNFDGPLNFSVGANYTRFKVLVDYYIFYNLITAFAEMPPFYFAPSTGPDISICPSSGYLFGPQVPAGDPLANCPYIDPNPIESINGDGHNYFRSKNPYKLNSAGYFGEVYWQVKDDVKVTAGLRYNDDRKTFTPVPSQVLMAPGIVMGGYVSRGYPSLPDIEQHWGKWTGRLGVDWKPDLSFTDQTMVYAFYSRGYKGGGANPPTPGFATGQDLINYGILTPEEVEAFAYFIPFLKLTAVDYGPTFKPEFVNAFEVGSKNTLLSGALQFNTDAFYYDYKDYQVSQIKDRTAVNENFDATTWGLEFQTVFSPSRDLQVIANLGYLDTRIADGETSIDIMNRTAGDKRYVVVKPWVQLPSNCVVPVVIAEQYPAGAGGGWTDLCGGIPGGTVLFDWADYPELNGGAGVKQDLGGNQLPNAPHWTVNLGAQMATTSWTVPGGRRCGRTPTGSRSPGRGSIILTRTTSCTAGTM